MTGTAVKGSHPSLHRQLGRQYISEEVFETPFSHAFLKSEWITFQTINSSTYVSRWESEQDLTDSEYHDLTSPHTNLQHTPAHQWG